MATIDILLPGMAWGTTVGTPAFCTVALVESDGTRILVDTAHVGRRVMLEEALAARGLTPADVDGLVKLSLDSSDDTDIMNSLGMTNVRSMAHWTMGGTRMISSWRSGTWMGRLTVFRAS
ncbi:MAG: hypothetical protein CFH40_01677 [Alphaproteobacteria bacterium MarineAlpha10_Bin3]|nr:MAG: hypothetical protein CFH40_01677 [Alphaproteobacteria bacterium MarineAlpha10_Bin3]PPR69821.1 MAG: hypothetical protein CFH09_01677 [Alphaproteobacteria bacterium MarineAlpha4_Bin1]